MGQLAQSGYSCPVAGCPLPGWCASRRRSGEGDHNSLTMPLMLELKYEHFIGTWPGRIKCVELFLALFCFMCGAPGYEGPQHWFLLVAALCFLGTIFFSLYYLCLAEPLNKLGVNWLMGEFWFTAGATFAYFTAFVAMLVNFSEREDEDWQYWIDANIAAGVFGLLNDVFYGLGAYLIYVEWKANPTGAPAPPPA